jgi:hypothetical protein
MGCHGDLPTGASCQLNLLQIRRHPSGCWVMDGKTRPTSRNINRDEPETWSGAQAVSKRAGSSARPGNRDL